MDIGRIIASHGKTQLEVAKAIGSTAGYISQLTSGKTNASMKRLDELATIIGCERWEFFMDEIEAAGFSVVRKEEQPAAAPTTAEPHDALPFTDETAALPAAPAGNGANAPVSAPASGTDNTLAYDLLTIDPVTGESRKYRLVK